MTAAEVRARVQSAVLLSQLAVREKAEAMGCLDRVKPGSIVKHYNTGKIGVIKDQQGQVMIDFHDNSGLRPIEPAELVNWDVIQEPSE